MSTNQEVIIVSGNPDLFPLEYCDSRTSGYNGVIPELYKKFSEESNYKIEYIDNGSTDRRIENYEDSQADIISGVVSDELIQAKEDESEIIIMYSTIDGVQYDFKIIISERASNAFKNEFTEFIKRESEEKEITNILETVSVKSERSKDMMGTYILFNTLAISILFVIVIAALINKIKKLKRREYMDSVTGINNFQYLQNNFAKKINDKTRILYHVVYIEPDIKTIYRIADRNEVEKFFKYIVGILYNHTNNNDMVVKLTDDNFLVLKQADNKEDVFKWTETILTEIEEYTAKMNKNFISKAWAGIYSLSKKDTDLDSIIEKAKYSSEYARENNRVYAECNAEIYNMFEERTRLEDRIRTALFEDEFIPYVQFITDTKTGKIAGGEVVSRWQHPYRGLLLPEKYIEIMENNQYIQPLDFKMLEKACELLEYIYSKNNRNDFFLACNISRKTLISYNFSKSLNELISNYHFPRNALVLEINAERHYTGDIGFVKDDILKNTNCRFTLDDFGTGHMAFIDINIENFDIIKIDKKLVNIINTDIGEKIIRGLINTSHDINKTVFAEGVDTQSIYDKLINLGCDFVQGKKVFYALPAAEAIKELYEK